jgi:hypothetical protein
MGSELALPPSAITPSYLPEQQKEARPRQQTKPEQDESGVTAHSMA